MRRSRLRKVLILLVPGCLLWLSCPTNVARFLAPTIQPALGQLFLDIAAVISADFLNPNQGP